MTPRPPNPYEILGVAPSATAEKIKQAYRQLAAKFHPDRDPSPEAGQSFKQVVEAYELLSDSFERAALDRAMGASAARRRPPGSASSDDWLDATSADTYKPRSPAQQQAYERETRRRDHAAELLATWLATHNASSWADAFDPASGDGWGKVFAVGWYSLIAIVALCADTAFDRMPGDGETWRWIFWLTGGMACLAICFPTTYHAAFWFGDDGEFDGPIQKPLWPWCFLIFFPVLLFSMAGSPPPEEPKPAGVEAPAMAPARPSPLGRSLRPTAIRKSAAGL